MHSFHVSFILILSIHMMPAGLHKESVASSYCNSAQPCMEIHYCMCNSLFCFGCSLWRHWAHCPQLLILWHFRYSGTTAWLGCAIYLTCVVYLCTCCICCTTHSFWNAHHMIGYWTEYVKVTINETIKRPRQQCNHDTPFQKFIKDAWEYFGSYTSSGMIVWEGQLGPWVISVLHQTGLFFSCLPLVFDISKMQTAQK